MQDYSAVNSDVLPSPLVNLSESIDYRPQTRVVFGPGSIDRLGGLACKLGAKRVFLVTDKGLAEAGHEKHGVDALTDSGLEVVVYDDVHCNPTTEDVDRALAAVLENNIDLIVGLGGGSSMDCAKGVNFLLTNGGKMEDYWGIDKATKPMLPMIAVPTTAGTGSEAQSFALIAHKDSHMKMACGDKKAACKIAILDPELTVSMPHSVSAATGIDAISHALESYVTKPRNVISQMFSLESWRLLTSGFPQILRDPNDLEARGRMLLGAHLAGTAIENAMLGATHALANPLSAHYDMTHGIAIGIMLPHVIRYNAEVVGHLYGKLANQAGLCEESDPNASDILADHMKSLVASAGLPTSLDESNVDPKLIPTMAEEAAKQWTGNFNPRPVDVESLKELYQCAFTN